MAATFTTWADLVRQLQSDLADRAWRRVQGYAVAGRSVQYRSLQELLELLKYAESQAAIESGEVWGRVYAANAGRG